MGRLAIVGAGLFSLVGSVGFAADLPANTYAKAALEAPIAAFNWTGCYVGGHVGGVLSEDRGSNDFGAGRDFSSAGFVGGGQVGCDYRFAPGWVVGAEGRAAWSSLKNSHSASVINSSGTELPSQVTFGNDFLASATARLGYSFADDRLLVFVRGGAAWTHEKVDDAFDGGALRGFFPSFQADPSATMTRTGWTVGTGIDWAFAPHWSANVEYNYYDFGSHGVTLVDTANKVTVSGLNLKDTIHAVTTGVDYHF